MKKKKKIKPIWKEWGDLFEMFVGSLMVVIMVDLPLILGVIVISSSLLNGEEIPFAGIVFLACGAFLRSILKRYGKSYLI